MAAGRVVLNNLRSYIEPFLGIRGPGTASYVRGPYLPAALGIIVGAGTIWLFLTASTIDAIIAISVLLVVWFSFVNMRFGLAGFAAALPTLVFVGITLIYPFQQRVSRDFFSTTAQVIPALFIAFAIESGVVRQRTRNEVKLLAVLLAVLLTIGEGAALAGLAAGEEDGLSTASVWELTMAVAAIAAGFLSIIISMLIREPTVVEEGQPDVEEGQPDVEEEQPDVEEEQPDVEEEQPDVEEGQPDVEEGQPDVEEGQPDVEEGQLDVEEGQPDVEEEQLDVEEEQLDVEEGQPDVEEEQLDVEEERSEVDR